MQNLDDGWAWENVEISLRLICAHVCTHTYGGIDKEGERTLNMPFVRISQIAAYQINKSPNKINRTIITNIERAKESQNPKLNINIKTLN